MSNLYDNIDHHLKKNKMSLYELSKRSKVPLTTLLSIKNGDSLDPRISTVAKLANTLSVSIDELYYGHFNNKIDDNDV